MIYLIIAFLTGLSLGRYLNPKHPIMVAFKDNDRKEHQNGERTDSSELASSTTDPKGQIEGMETQIELLKLEIVRKKLEQQLKQEQLKLENLARGYTRTERFISTIVITTFLLAIFLPPFFEGVRGEIKARQTGS